MQTNLTNEVNDIIKEIEEITKRTDIINQEYSIQPSNRKILSMDTEKLKEISNRMKKISILLDDQRLKNIGEEIDILAKNREIRDNQKYISEVSYYDEFTGKQNKNSSERLEQEANSELLKELSEELKEEINRIQTTEKEKKNEKEQLEQDLNNLERKEKIEQEINILSSQLPILFKASIMKEVANITKTPSEVSENISSLKELASVNAQEWKGLKTKLKNIETIISSNLLEKSEIEKIKGEATKIQQQIQNCVKYASVYHKINERIKELKDISEKLPSEITKEETRLKLDTVSKEREKEHLQRQENLLKAEKEEEYNKKFKQVEKQLIESMEKLPEELQITLGIKLESEQLLTTDIDKILRKQNTTQKNTQFESILEYQTRIEKNTASVNNSLKIINEEQKKYNELVIREHTEGLSTEDNEYKDKLKNYIEKIKQDILAKEEENRNYQRTIRNYNQTNKLIDELIELTNKYEKEQNKPTEPLAQNNKQNQEKVLEMPKKELSDTKIKNIEDLEMPEFLKENIEKSKIQEKKNQTNTKENEAEQKELPEKIDPKDIEVLDANGNKIEQEDTKNKQNSYKELEFEDNEKINIESLSEKDIDDAVNTFEEEKNKKGIIDKIKHVVKSVRKPKDKEKIKKSIKWKIATLATKLVLIGSGLVALGSVSKVKNDELVNQTRVDIISETDNTPTMEVFDENGNSQEIITTEESTYNDDTNEVVNMEPVNTNEVTMEVFDENGNSQEIITTSLEDTEDSLYTSLGKDITVNANSPIYRNAYNAYLESDGMIPYFESNEERKIIGLAFWNDETGFKSVYTYQENTDEMIKNIINDGSKLIAVLTQIKNKNGNFEPEGWYSLNDINLTKQLEKGVSR